MPDFDPNVAASIAAENTFQASQERPAATVRQYRKKPVVIEAVQWTGENYREVYALYDPDGDKEALRGERGDLFIPTLEGVMRASQGDFLVKGVRGEFYPVKAVIFGETYEPVT